MQCGKYVLRRHDLLHELTVIRRRCLQRRVGIGECRLRVADLLVEFGTGDRTGRDRRTLLLRVGQVIALAIQISQLRRCILTLADRLGHLRVARVLRQACRGLRDLLAGDAALRELRRGEHLGQQRLALVLLAGRLVGVHVETGCHQHRRGASLQCRQHFHGVAANRQGGIILASFHQLSRPQQIGFRQRL